MNQQKSKKEKFNERLRKSMKKKDFIKFYRTGTAGDANIYGFIIQMSKDFLLIQNEEEFRLNGYSIIRRDRFDSIRISKTEVLRKKILNKEGILKSDYGLDTKINLKSLETIFKDLKQKDYFSIVECEDLKKPSFIIGEISKVSNKSVGIRYFSPKGIINKKPTKVKYKKITLVKFNDRYTNLYRKYLKEEK